MSSSNCCFLTRYRFLKRQVRWSGIPISFRIFHSSLWSTQSKALAAAAAKSLQSCPTLRDPIDGSPPGSPVPGVLQARTLEWVAFSFSSAWKWKGKVKSLNHVQLLVTPWTAAYQAPPSMGFSRQEYWSGVPLPSPELPGVTGKFCLGVKNKANQRLTELCQENALVIANTLFQQNKGRLYTWTSPDGQYRNQIDLYSLQPKMEKLYTVSKKKKKKMGSWLLLRSWTS